MRIDSPSLVGITTITGSASITGSLTPGIDSSYDFGSLSKKWNNVYATAFSGSLTKLSDGSPYLVAGSNITITTGSTGAVTISSASESGTLFGAGTTNYLSKYTSPNSLGDSGVYDNGSGVGIGSTSFTARLFVSGSASINQATLSIKSGISSQEAPVLDVQNSVGESLLFVSGSGNVGIGTAATADRLSVNGSVSVAGSLLPGADVSYSLGSVTNRWANIYTGDLHLRNERGDWTIIEEDDCLTVRNNKTGKRYKINMTPLPELDEEVGKFSTGPKPNSQDRR
jgi:hypothetical protein